MPLSVFSIFTVSEFARFLQSTTFSRKITFVQNHYTLKPDYPDFNAGSNRHMALLEGTRRFHIETNKWSDIGQNITTFPDGTIGYCRPLDIQVVEQVVYHHWFDTAGSRFNAGQINSGRVLNKHLQKTYPGTNFFSGSNGMQGKGGRRQSRYIDSRTKRGYPGFEIDDRGNIEKSR